MKNSKIGWTHHSFNLVWGCSKVSEACRFCYAESFAKRAGWGNTWGPDATRRTQSARYWKEPLKWNEEAAAAGERLRVFCQSMGDVFEDHPITNFERLKLWPLIRETPWLDWLLLTKRPENIVRFVETESANGLPPNVWLGVTAETHMDYWERGDWLQEAAGKLGGCTTFLSCEPLLEKIRIDPDLMIPDWIICGGESGPQYNKHPERQLKPEWARSLRDQCAEHGIAFYFKQWGGIHPDSNGRELDDREWSEFPVGKRSTASQINAC